MKMHAIASGGLGLFSLGLSALLAGCGGEGAIGDDATGVTSSAASGGPSSTSAGTAATGLVGAGGGASSSSGSGGEGGTPVPDVRPTRFVAPTGDDAGTCTKEAPCLTFDRAYHVATTGEAVEVAEGSYDDQTFTSDDTKSGPDRVIFQPAPSAEVTTGWVEAHVKHIELRDMTIHGFSANEQGHDLTLRNVALRQPFFIMGASNVSILGGEVGPVHDDKCMVNEGSNGEFTKNLLIDGVSFHDFTITPNSDVHMECILMGAADGLTIRNSTFHKCAIYDILLGNWVDVGPTGGMPTNVLFENNFFGAPEPGWYPVHFAGGLMPDEDYKHWVNVHVRNNSFGGALLIDAAGTATDFRVENNIGYLAQSGCNDQVTYAYNVWHGGAQCAPTDLDAPAGFVDEDAGDMHLLPGAAAIDYCKGADAPAKDIDGEARPKGGGTDCGADEAM